MPVTADQKTMHKFIFETNFDDPIGAASSDDKPNEALEAIKKQAFTAGQQQALQSIERQTGEICVNILKHLQHIVAQYGEIQEALTYKSLSVVLYSLQKLVPDLLSMHTEEQIELTVKRCLQFALDMPKLTIKISDQIYGDVQPRLQELVQQAGFHGKATILADPSLKMGDCRIEWGNGGMENLPTNMWQAIHNVLYESMPKKLAESIPTDLQDPLPPEPEPEPAPPEPEPVELAAETPNTDPDAPPPESEQSLEPSTPEQIQPEQPEPEPEKPATEQPIEQSSTEQS